MTVGVKKQAMRYLVLSLCVGLSLLGTVLRLIDVIDWPWRYIMLPIWGNFAVGVFIILGAFVWTVVKVLLFKKG